jgi:prepilin-type processing-associated H-X9-DG protein
VFAKAREKARQTSCLSNVRQISVAFLSYAQDYDEMLVPMNNRGGVWYDLIAPYIKNTQIYKCPSSTFDYGYGVSYPNLACDAGATPPNGGRGAALGVIAAPADALMLGETENDNPNPSMMTFYYSLRSVAMPCPWAPTYMYNGIPYPGRHNGGNNVGFCDGHAKWINTQTMIDRTWSGWTSQPATVGG